MVHSSKMYPTHDCTFFQVLARVMSGTLHAGQNIRLLGENYSLADEEDSRELTVGRLWIYEARYVLQVPIFLVKRSLTGEVTSFSGTGSRSTECPLVTGS